MSSCADKSRQDNFTLKSHDPRSFHKVTPLPMGLLHQISVVLLQDVEDLLSYGFPGNKGMIFLPIGVIVLKRRQ